MTFLLADATVPFADMVTRAADTWLFSSSGIFLAEGMSWITKIMIIVIGGIGLKWGFTTVAGGDGMSTVPTAVYRLTRCLVALWMLKYYNTPIYGAPSIHQLVPEAARQLLLQVHNDSQKKALGVVNAMQVNADKESDWWNPADAASAELMAAMVSLFDGLMVLLSCGGYILMAIAVTVGPLSIPWLAFDSTAWLFWDWLQVLISASMFQVIAAILVNIWCNIMVYAGDYLLTLSVMQMAVMFAALNIALFISALFVGWITNSLYGKGASAAANLAQGAVNTTVSVVKHVAG